MAKGKTKCGRKKSGSELKKIDLKLEKKFTMEEVCRTCAAFFDETSSLHSIFDQSAITTSTDNELNILNELIAMQIMVEEDDGLPQQICNTCAKRLSDIHKFRELCKNSQIVLKEYFNRANTDLKDSDGVDSDNKDASDDMQYDNCSIGGSESSEEEKFNPDADDVWNSSSKLRNKKTSHTSNSMKIKSENDEQTSISEDVDMTNISKRLRNRSVSKIAVEEVDNKNQKVAFAGDVWVPPRKVRKESNTLRITPSSCRVRKCDNCNKFYRASRHKSDSTACIPLIKIDKSFIAKNSVICCFYCNETFDSDEIIEDHILHEHSTDRPFKCEVCSELFPSLRTRSTHMRIHNTKNDSKSHTSKKNTKTADKNVENPDGDHKEKNIKQEITPYVSEDAPVIPEENENSIKKKILDKWESSTEEDKFCTDEDDDWTPPPKDIKKLKAARVSPNKEATTKSESEDQSSAGEDSEIITTSRKSRKNKRNSRAQSSLEEADKASETLNNKTVQSTPSGPVRKCNQCNKYSYTSRFKTDTLACASSLKLNQSNVVKDSVISCFYCDKEFGTEQIISDHILEKHPKDRPFECEMCNELFPNLRARTTHMRIHNIINTYTCDICGKVFRSKPNLKDHKERIHENGEYTCEICMKVYTSMKTFKCHIKSHREKQLDEEEISYKCEVCDKNFKGESYFRMHMKTHDSLLPHVCNVCGKGFPFQSALKQHEEIHNIENFLQFQCEYCGKQFRNTGTLNSHILTHSKEVGTKIEQNVTRKRREGYYYECPKCPTKCRLQSAFEKHLRMHDEDRKFPCSECNNAYTRVEHLRRHIDKAHLKNRKYPCDFCNRTFLDAYARNNHQRIHENKRYPCSHCNKVFKTEKCLKYHERVHTGDRPYPCQICGKGFIDGSSLRCHLFKHTKEEHEMAKAKILASNMEASSTENKNITIHHQQLLQQIHESSSNVEKALEWQMPGPSFQVFLS